MGFGVPVLNVVTDLLGEHVDRGDGASIDRLTGDDAELGCNLVYPRGSNRCGVETNVRIVWCATMPPREWHR